MAIERNLDWHLREREEELEDRSHDDTVRRERHSHELNMKRAELKTARINAWLRVPLAIVQLPAILVALLIIAFKKEAPESVHNFINKY